MPPQYVMNSKTIYMLWLAIFAGVLVCVGWPTHAPAQKAPTTLAPPTTSNLAVRGRTQMPYRGVAIQVQRVDWIDRYKKSVDEIAAVGADTVSLVVDTRMENGTSSRIWLDMRMTPTPDQLGALIDHAKSRGLRVMLMPIVLLDNPRNDKNEWRGNIEPESWSDWWESYRQMITHFAWIAEAHKVDILVVGSELVSTEDKADEWRKTIGEVRAIFSGNLTYSSNWDHYVSIPFWNQLGLIGMNSYWKLGNDHKVTVSEIKENWSKIQKDLLEFKKKIGKPLLFTEVGWCSLANAAHEPWDYTRTSEDIDLNLQKRLYQGFFESWYGNPNLGGFMVWEWPPDQGGLDNKGYIPKGKPAEVVMREWLSKPRWEVK